MDGPATEPANEHHDAYAPEPRPDRTSHDTVDAGPAAAGRALRASDAARGQVAALLSAAYAEGRLTREEHDERLGQVLAARTFDDLIPLTADLVPLGPTPSTVSTPTPQFVVGNGGNPETDRMVAVFGGGERKGRWRGGGRRPGTPGFGGGRPRPREGGLGGPRGGRHGA